MIKIFISYSHKDEIYREELEKHLTMLQRNRLVNTWSDRKIMPGQEWDNKIRQELECADIILLLISSDFLASNYCYDIEIKKAIEKHENSTAIVVPIIVRYCDWHEAPFGKLQGLPIDGKPIKNFGDTDKAYLEVVKKLKLIISNFIEQKTKVAIEPTTQKVENNSDKNNTHQAEKSSNIKIIQLLTKDFAKEVTVEIEEFNKFLIANFPNRFGLHQQPDLDKEVNNRNLIFFKCKALGIDIDLIKIKLDKMRSIICDIENVYKLDMWSKTDWYPDEYLTVSSFIDHLLMLISPDWFNFHFPTIENKKQVLDFFLKSEKYCSWKKQIE